MKKLTLIAVTVSTALFAYSQTSAGGSPTPILILGAFAFFFALAFINPPARRNITQKEKQVSLMRSLGAGLPPDRELDPEEARQEEER